jgi:hypothetical protein
MHTKIPASVLEVIADVVSAMETHAALDRLFFSAGAPGEPPPGSKRAKVLEWLRRVNDDSSVEPLAVLGRLIEGYMGPIYEPRDVQGRESQRAKERILHVLAQWGLQYVPGGRVVPSPRNAPDGEGRKVFR